MLTEIISHNLNASYIHDVNAGTDYSAHAGRKTCSTVMGARSGSYTSVFQFSVSYTPTRGTKTRNLVSRNVILDFDFLPDEEVILIYNDSTQHNSFCKKNM